MRPDPATFGQSVLLVASVTATSPGGSLPNGTVTFEEVGTTTTTLGTENVRFGTAKLRTNALPVGSNEEIEAVFNPANGNYLTSTGTGTETVNQATPKVKLSTPPGSFPLSVGGALTVTATVGLSSGYGFGFRFGFCCGGGGSTSTVPQPTGTVSFYLGSTTGPALLTENLTSGQASYTFTGLPQGTDALIVVYSGDTNYAGATGTLNVTVPTPTPTSSGLKGSSNSAAQAHQSVMASYGLFR